MIFSNGIKGVTKVDPRFILLNTNDEEDFNDEMLTMRMACEVQNTESVYDFTSFSFMLE